MPVKERAEEVTRAVVGLLGAEASPEHAEQITKIVERALIDAYRDCTERNTQVAWACCEEDRDKAHKIADEMRRANIALVANLSSLR